MYKQLIRPILFKLSPERVHNITLRMLGVARRIPLLGKALRLFFKYDDPSLRRNLFGLEFPNPVGLAAGIDQNGDHYNELAWFGFSFIEIGSLTPEPQDGNPRPRLFRLPQDRALINRMGINNKGMLHAINRIKSDPPRTIICASIAKNSSSASEADIVNDYKKAFSYLSDLVDPLLDLRVCYDTYKPLLVKVSPDIPHEELDEILNYCLISGIDGIVAGNTTTSREGLTTPREKVEKIGNGGLSGAPLFERSLALVRYIHDKTEGRLPVIGVGGIMNADQATQMLQAGASLIEICTGFVYEGPSAVKNILKNLK